MNKAHILSPALSGAVSLIVLCIVLSVGLWPFHAPHNQVDWLRDRAGLHFGGRGSVVSADGLQANSSDSHGSSSLELWLQPDKADGTQNILSFYVERNQAATFSVRQYHDDLLLQNEVRGRFRSWRQENLEYSGVFFRGKPVFVTVTAGEQKTSVYVDGVLVGTSKTFPLSNESMKGRLVLANSAVDDDSWSGQVFGLAIYGRELTPAQIARHYCGWMENRKPLIVDGESPIAVYGFNERAGNVVHDHVGTAPSLLIPQHYFVLHPHFLQAPWDEFSFRWYYWKDVGINVVGFVPLGFFFYASLSRIRRRAAATILLGFTISLIIEISQAFLPTRESGTTDLLTNTLGTTLGTVLYRIAEKQFLGNRVDD
jgi:hypothetical protein